MVFVDFHIQYISELCMNQIVYNNLLPFDGIVNKLVFSLLVI